MALCGGRILFLPDPHDCRSIGFLSHMESLLDPRHPYLKYPATRGNKASRHLGHSDMGHVAAARGGSRFSQPCVAERGGMIAGLITPPSGRIRIYLYLLA
ncbi:hypothetical protein Bbelb_183750 [Branchiostoma belcheri]|nr:hypothetical protein Bbelb_183750 [Branchiostoma belcheri]